ncbi:C40 family peptidase [Actinomadura parmotrematis]|uniref:C40 family peptidase n=1 Tax=Actinomadura parmotrematis TaxID=2864039 RepID=A0ABS7FXR3_9ACTN|nr:NlpC/P60 family protein [Actinomadura parmotrematis]MBW8484945.1 C40 family peptidase [Actinomadura parmotrematis]
MLRRIRYGRRAGGDAGLATSALVVGMALLLTAGVLVFGRLGQASDLRQRAQIGADAAAIGAIAPLRDQAVSLVMEGIDPAAAGYWSVRDEPEVPAGKYAGENNAVLRKVTLSGATGDTAQVSVATKECQLKRKDELSAKEKEDLRNRRNLCTDAAGKKGIGRVGAATAVAKLILPHCVFLPADPLPGDTGIAGAVRVVCDGVTAYPVADRAALTRVFKIRLVDQPSAVPYTGQPTGLVAGGGAVVNHCATDGSVPAENLPFGARVVAWALCYLGTPYSWGGGGPSGPSLGICCSPGGYSGARTVGFDCSGLTLFAVYQASKGRIALGHYTGDQISDSRGTVVTGQMEAGDLIFYGNPTHHVAIYYGDGKMVEAPQTGLNVRVTPVRGGVSGVRRFG